MHWERGVLITLNKLMCVGSDKKNIWKMNCKIYG